MWTGSISTPSLLKIIPSRKKKSLFNNVMRGQLSTSIYKDAINVLDFLNFAAKKELVRPRTLFVTVGINAKRNEKNKKVDDGKTSLNLV